jgi:hypothetical protein
MKKCSLDLSEYEVYVKVHVRNEETQALEIVEKDEVYPLRDNLSQWLRIPGIWKNGVEICDACDLAKQIKNCTEDSLEINEDELKLLQAALNKLIEQKEDPQRGVVPLGGAIHEEVIRRVFRLKAE